MTEYRTMNRLHMCMYLAITLGGAIACSIDTGQARVEIPLYLSGTTTSNSIQGRAGITYTINRADLAFGALYFCAGSSAGDLCDTARLEWLDSAIINLLDDTPKQVGLLQGLSGSIQSWMYDLGYSSQLSSNDPFVLEAAQQLNASIVIEGEATLNEQTVPFVAAIPIQQNDDTELGVPVVRKSSSELFSYVINAEQKGLLIQFNVEDLIDSLDLSIFFNQSGCEDREVSISCEGDLAIQCMDESSSEVNENCADAGQECIPNFGCADSLVIEASTQAYRALRNALFVAVRPTFTWDFTP